LNARSITKQKSPQPETILRQPNGKRETTTNYQPNNHEKKHEKRKNKQIGKKTMVLKNANLPCKIFSGLCGQVSKIQSIKTTTI
jgi:hypothetical protein